MPFLGKNAGSHVSGSVKWLGKQISNGSSYLGKAHRLIGSAHDRYSDVKNNIVRHVNAYNPNLGGLLKAGAGLLEKRVGDFVQPFTSQLNPLMRLGQGIGSSLQGA